MMRDDKSQDRKIVKMLLDQKEKDIKVKHSGDKSYESAETAVIKKEEAKCENSVKMYSLQKDVRKT